uniref:ANK_REP_REGION domain-containing protein n=1 Tax=Macrostomum lignano TaxID=282301 RepID=A0A1I8IB57_9PLAT
NTALHYACKHAGSSARSLELLLSNGAQLQQNYNGETPVDVAVLNNNGPAISLLFSDAYCDWVMSYRKDTGMSHMDILIQHSPQTALTILNRSMTKSGADNFGKEFHGDAQLFSTWTPAQMTRPPSPTATWAFAPWLSDNAKDLLKHPLCAALLESFTRYFFWCDFFFYAVFLCCPHRVRGRPGTAAHQSGGCQHRLAGIPASSGGSVWGPWD